jgi:hypothetical protein
MTLLDNFPNLFVWLPRKLRTFLSGREGDGGIGLEDTLDVGVDY